MGRKAQKRPKHLVKKLVLIRKQAGVTQAGMAVLLRKAGAERTTRASYVGDFETGRRIPSLLTLLAYARIAKTSTDCLIDDTLNLPN